MITSKLDFIKKFLPKRVEDIDFAQIDLDISDLSLSDLLRNLDATYPKNGKLRNQIISGHRAVGILCRSELLYPMKGVLLVVVNSDEKIEMISQDYVVITVSEEDIVSDEKILSVVNGLTRYLIENFSDVISEFEQFYLKYIYDPQEDAEWEEAYGDEEDE